MVTPAWGVPAERYEEEYLKVVEHLGITDLGSPILTHIEPGARVLDLGCATGRQARLMRDRGCTVVGVERDPDAAQQAGAWCERVIVCDLDVADLVAEVGSDRFDVIAAGDILEHLRDPAQLLRSSLGLLRPGGRVVASVPNVAHGSVRLALLTGTFSYEETGILDRTHLRFFTLESISALFESAGLEVVHVGRTEVPIDGATPYDRSRLPRGVEKAVARMPEATTFGFVIVAVPTGTGVSPTSASTPRSSRFRRSAR